MEQSTVRIPAPKAPKGYIEVSTGLPLAPLSFFKPYKNNPRDNRNAVPVVMKSICDYGFNVPVTVSEDGTLVTGHTRYEAAKALGMEQIPYLTLSHLSGAEQRGYRLADNRTQEFSGYDMDLLRLELKELEPLGFDSRSYGLDSQSIPMLGADPAPVQAETTLEVEDLPDDEPASYQIRDPRMVQCPHCGEWFSLDE